MIKIKLTNKHDKYDYSSLRRCFGGLVRSQNILKECSIELVTGGSYDYEFLDKNCFMDRHKPLSQSIEKGINNLINKTGDYFLFDGGDDTSLMASYEVFTQSNAKGLFKPQLLNRKDYKTPSFLGMWFRNESHNNLSYNIPKKVWKNINLCGYNLGHAHPNLTSQLYSPQPKDIDVVGIWQGKHKYNKDYGIENYLGYTNHRTSCWDILNQLKDKYNIVTGQYDPNTTFNTLSRSRIGVSPFGQGELCFRDFEIIQHNALLIKPDISKIKTSPNWLIPYETYIPCKLDWSDLNEIIINILSDFKKYKHVIENAKQKMIESYKLGHVGMHWYNFFTNLDGITNEK